MIEQTYELFFENGHAIEVRGLIKNAGTNAAWEGWAKGTVVGYFNDRDKFTEAVTNLNAVDCKAIYICPNPGPADLLAVANNRFVASEKGLLLSDNKVIKRNWLIIDIDPDRLPGISASKDEMELARSVASGILGWLNDVLGVNPHAIMSGNGIHVLVPVDFPNDDEHNRLCLSFLKYVKSLFEEDGVVIDPQTSNISRATKVLETWVRKGENLEGFRPHRRVKLLREGSRDTLLTAEKMREYYVEDVVAAHSGGSGDSEADQEYWTPARLLGEYLGKADNGRRNRTGFDLAAALRDQGYSIDVAKDMLTRYQAAVPGDGYELGDAMASVEQAYSRPARDPRKAPRKYEENDDDEIPTVEEVEELLGLLGKKKREKEEEDDVVEEDSEDDEDDEIDVDPQARYNFPYLGSKDNETFYLVRTKNGLKDNLVAGFVAWIEKEIDEEFGEKYFLIRGVTKSGKEFDVEVAADDMMSKLPAILESAAGAMDGIAPKMQAFVLPSIKAFTTNVQHVKRYNRVGWLDNRFLLPGRELPGIEQAPIRQPFRIYVNGSDGTDTLRCLIQALPEEKTTVLLSFLLAAPLANVVGWRNKRFACFIQGRFNSLKTAWASAAMSIYGDFVNADNLLRWGEGATNVGLVGNAISVADMPLFIDNFKPQTGRGVDGFVGFIHSVLEGGEKERGDGRGRLRETRPIYTWPFITGESVPDKDAATITRTIVVEFQPQKVGLNEYLAKAQENAHSLPAIGHHWITWLESDEGQAIAREIADELPGERTRWANIIMDDGSNTNALRVAGNLALLSLTWKIALRHPVIGPVLANYSDKFESGLRVTSRLLATATEESTEGETFLRVLAQLIETGRAKIINTRQDGPSITDGERMVGWEDSFGVYILPDVAISLVLRVVGFDGLNKISLRTLYNQLKDLDAIVPSKKSATTTKSYQGSVSRVLHLKPGILKKYYAKENIEEEEMAL